MMEILHLGGETIYNLRIDPFSGVIKLESHQTHFEPSKSCIIISKIALWPQVWLSKSNFLLQ